MKILIVLTYFQPHKSGLTVYAIRQAQALVERGHQVTVLTSQYDPSLAAEEEVEGVRIVRLPVAFRLSKGVIMPRMPFEAWRQIKKADVVNLHVPQVDAALLAFLTKLLKKPLVLTYHCDLIMPSGWVNQLAGWAAQAANSLSAALADVVVHNTRDFAENSRFLKRYLQKLVVIQPPIKMQSISDEQMKAFKKKYHILPEQFIVGMVARLAAEKGVEYLVKAMPIVLKAHPGARVIFVGEYHQVFGEQAYREKLLPMIEQLGDHWLFFGMIPEEEKTIFYHLCDVLVLPSINSTESFGMVQVEAMTCGTPVIATDLPGVRQPVQMTGMGKVIPPKDSQALADAINKFLDGERLEKKMSIPEIIQFYAPETVVNEYETVYRNLLGRDE